MEAVVSQSNYSVHSAVKGGRSIVYDHEGQNVKSSDKDRNSFKFKCLTPAVLVGTH